MRYLIKTPVLIVILFFLFHEPFKEKGSSFAVKHLGAPIKIGENYWVDSVFNAMTLAQRIAQLFMIDVYSNQNKYYEKKLLKTIKTLQPGGVVFMEGNPTHQVELTNQLQQHSQVPLLVGIDGERGISMRLDSIIDLPKAMAVGAVENDQLAFDMGVAVGHQCKRMGIQVNFAPVLDVSSNPNNPIINSRSFGEDKRNVARKGLAFATGLQSQQIIAVGKHFPGHGDTQTDSHTTLPVLLHEAKRLFDVELYPFVNLIHNELIGIMTGHIAVPSLDDGAYRPASLSPVVVQHLLKDSLGFQGLVFTDALNMGGVTRDNIPGEIVVKALLAGNDVLLFPADFQLAINAIKLAIQQGRVSESLVNEKCLKILKAKQWAGLAERISVSTRDLVNDINSIELEKVQRELLEASQTLVLNKNEIPIQKLDEQKILCLALGTTTASEFFSELNRYSKVDTLVIEYPYNLTQAAIDTLLKNYTSVIVGQFGLIESPRHRFGISQSEINFIERIKQRKPVILNWFGNPYGLKYFPRLDDFTAVLVSYGNDRLSMKVAAQAIFGGIPLQGILPVSINNKWRVGQNPTINFPSRVSYATPALFDLSDSAFARIDSLARFAIDTGATPGCQIVYAKNGRVIYDKCFGYYTYKKEQEVSESSIYDLASVTKVAATTLALMKLYDERHLEPAMNLSTFYPAIKGTDKKNIRIDQLMAHHSGLKSWIPFYRHTLDSIGNLDEKWYRNAANDTFNIRVASGMYLRKDFVDTLFQSIVDTPLYHKNRYRYSDLGFYWLGQLVQTISGEPLDEFVASRFYSRLGLQHTTFNPIDVFPVSQMVPTENDKLYRHQIVQGYVHDQGAAVMGGVSGHAGLFSTADDLLILGQMLLNKGDYGGETYFSSNTFDVFNKQYFKRRHNRRALGFDKPALKLKEPGPTCESASQQSFGHSGFTGTYLWIDPENQSVYVFLSNRTYPNAENNLLLDLNIRTEIQQAFYDVFK